MLQIHDTAKRLLPSQRSCASVWQTTKDKSHVHERENDPLELQPTRTEKPRCAVVIRMSSEHDHEGWSDGHQSTESEQAVDQ